MAETAPVRNAPPSALSRVAGHATDAAPPAEPELASPKLVSGEPAPAAKLPEAPPTVPPPAATANAAPALPAQHSLRGAPDTVAALSAEILRKLDGRSTRFEVELQPAGLGRVDIRIEIGASGKLTAAFAVDTPQAAAELRGRAGELSRALEQAGFDVSGGLSFDLSNSSGGFGREPETQQEASAWRGRAFAGALAASEAADAAALPPTLSRRLNAGLDIWI
ncbi:MAG: flagellar hook-length control protein FliK [Phenylobacterium sp.]